MQRPSNQNPSFTPGTRLSRLPVRTGEESLEDFYRDLFDNTGPEHDREHLLRLLDEDVTDGAAARGRANALDHLGQAFRRIDAWTYQGDFLPQADRAELKRRVAHNLLAALPGLNLAAEAAPAGPDRAILRQVQDEHRAWRRGFWDAPSAGQHHRPWDGHTLRQEQGRNRAFPMGGQDREPGESRSHASDQASPQSQRTCWVFLAEPTACDRCLEMAGKVHTEKPERPHPNCKCRIESRTMTAREAHAFLADQAAREKAIRAQRERLEQERKTAKLKAKTPAYVDDSRWSKDGDPVTITGKDKNGRPVRQTFNGHALPDKTKGGVAIKIKDHKQIDRRVTKEMSDTLQTVLDDPRCKQAGITEVTISSTTDGQHSGAENRHYQGKAVDISRINGKSIKDDPTARRQAEVMQKAIADRAKEKGIKDNLGPNALDIYDTNGQIIKSQHQIDKHDDHVHIAIY